MAKRSRPAAFIDDPLWYKDAVIYQLHIKSFFDANNDGIGDFAGLISKLDYIAELGVTTLWLADEIDGSQFESVWRTWWLGDMGGALIVAPALLVLTRLRDQHDARERVRLRIG